MSESAIYGIEMVIVLPLSLKESVDPAPSFAVGKYNFAVREYNVAVWWQVHGGVAAVEEPGHVPPARPQQLLHAVAEEPWTRQQLESLDKFSHQSRAVIQFDFRCSNCTFSISFQFRA